MKHFSFYFRSLLPWLLSLAGAGCFFCVCPGRSQTSVSGEAPVKSSGETEASLRAKGLDDLGYAALNHCDFTKAKEYYRQALEIRENSSPGTLGIAKSSNNLGVAELYEGNFAAAKDRFNAALTLEEKLDPSGLETARSLNGLGSVAQQENPLYHWHVYLLNSATAERDFRQALAIAEKRDPEGREAARSLSSLSRLARRQGDFPNAQRYGLQALAISEKLDPENMDMVTNLHCVAMVFYHQGDLTTAFEYCQRALKVQEKLAPISLPAETLLRSLGMIAYHQGDLVKSAEYYRRALALTSKLDPNSIVAMNSLTDLGTVAMEQGDFNAADEYYVKALNVQAKLGRIGQYAHVVVRLGSLALAKGELAKAEEYYQRALVIRQKQVPNGLPVAWSLNEVGFVAEARGDLDRAEKCQNQALAIVMKYSPNTPIVAKALNSLGDISVDRGNLAKAENYYQQALEIWVKTAPATKDCSETLADLAKIKWRQGHLDEAAQFFERALAALESQTGRLEHSDEVQYYFRAKHLSCYQDYIDLLVQLNRPELALQVLERSRAQRLLEMLAESHIDVRTGANAALLQQDRLIRADIVAKSDRRINLLGAEHTESQIAAVTVEIETLLARYKEIERQIKVSSPRYAALMRPQALSAKEIQGRLLDADTLLLEYSLGQEHSCVFAITSDAISVYPLPKRAEIEDVARQAYKEISYNDPTARYKDLKKLSRILLEPVKQGLGHKRLAIVADGVLQYISFAALWTPQDDRLMSGHEIVYLPSASTLAELRLTTAGRKPAPKQLAVLADPVFDRNDERVSGALTKSFRGESVAANGGERGGGRSLSDDNSPTRSASGIGLPTYLPRLPNTRREADNIVALIPAGERLEALDFEASRATAISPSLAQYRIVHFATHGLIDSRHPELSGLVLSLVDANGEPESGFLGLQDIYNLNWSADLVVLSACETGLGQEIQGEGLIGLTRAFMYAGAPRVVASLWRVPDEATAELMTQFYIGMLTKGLPPAAALRQAQLSMAGNKRWSAPYYWAGFTMEGEWK